MNFTHRYSDTMHNSRVVIIGPYPPPLGGVSVHIQRVMYKLKKQNNIVLHFPNNRFYKYFWLKFFPFKIISYIWYFICFFFKVLIKKSSHVVYHTMCYDSGLIELGLLVFNRLLLGSKITVVEHNCRHMYTRSTWWKNIFNYFLQHTDQVIFIGLLPYQSYTKNNIRISRYAIEGAFLLPDIYQEKAIIKTYPSNLLSFIKQDAPILLMNGSHIKLWQDQDVYGFDQMISACAQLRQLFPSIKLIIMLANMDNEAYFVKLQYQIKKYALEDHIFINVGQYELWPLLKRVDLFVRPTVCDGASISLEEALYFGTPVVASNVCTRPEGTILYQQGDIDDLVQKISMVLKEINHGAVDQQRDHVHTQ